MRYRVLIETERQATGAWAASWQYEVGPCRGGPCGKTSHFATEGHAAAAALLYVAQSVRPDAPMRVPPSHCPQGHVYEGENLKLLGVERRCRACERLQKAERRKREKPQRWKR